MSNITAEISRSKGMGPALRAAFRQPAFVVAVVVLFLAALGLNGATQALQLYFKKLPVPLARPLDQIPEKLGKWVQVSHDEPLDHEVQEALNTNNFVFRNYVLEDETTREELPKFKDKTNKERMEILSKIQVRHPEKVMSFAVTYYTGLVDTVAHIPDRCYLADGYVPESYTKPYWKVKNKDGQDFEVQTRYINFEDKSSRLDKKVAYFFHVNGHYEEDPLGVRRSLQNLFRKHGYYAKVELMTTIRDGEKSAAVMSDFLCAALPEVEKCLPDWNAIEGK